MNEPVQLLAETAEPMIFMKSVTVILWIGKVVFPLVLSGNEPDGALFIVNHMNNQSDHQDYLSPLVVKIVSTNL